MTRVIKITPDQINGFPKGKTQSNTGSRSVTVSPDNITGLLEGKSPSNLTSRVSSLAQKTFGKTESLWRYAGKGVTITKRVFQAGAEASPKIASKVGKAISGLKIFKAVEIPLNLVNAGQEAFNIPSYLKIHDWEGATLASTGLMLLLLDTVDAFSTLTELVLDLPAFPVLAAVNQAMLPLAIGLVSVSSVIEGYKATVTVVQLAHLNKNLKNGDFDKYVQKLVGITGAEEKNIRSKLKENLSEEEIEAEFDKQVEKLKKLKVNRLQRRANSKAVKALQDAIDNPEKAEKALKSLRKALIINTCVHVATILTNLVILTGLILFFVPVPPVLPFIFLGLGTVMKLGIIICDDLIIPQISKHLDKSDPNTAENAG